MNNKNVRQHIFITEEQKQALRKMAYEQNISISQIIRELIEKLLEDQK